MNTTRVTNPQGFISATGTKRRIRALRVNGWTNRELQKRLGYTETGGGSFAAILKHKWITPSVAGSVRALYEQLRDVPGPSRNVQNQAIRRGYPSPMCWDGVDMDDPDAEPARQLDEFYQPDPVALTRVRHGEIKLNDLLDIDQRYVVTKLQEEGVTINETARLLQTTPRQIARVRAEAREEPRVAAIDEVLEAVKETLDALAGASEESYDGLAVEVAAA